MGERTSRLEEFRAAGVALFSLGLVKGREGNLSVFDGTTLRITRAGAALAELGDDDVLEVGLEGEAPGASTDLEVHRRMYRDRGPGAVAHAHPGGTVVEGEERPGEHGVYVFAATLVEAVETAVDAARRVKARGPEGGSTR